METITNAKLEAMLRKVQAMLARADHPNTPPAEADTARNMAEALMYRYRLDEAMLAEAGDIDTLAPSWGSFYVCDGHSEFRRFYGGLAEQCLRHFDCRGVLRYVSDEEHGFHVRMEVVGFDSDRRMAEALYTSVMLAFGQRLEPKYDPSLSDQANAYIMRSAGMEGRRIAMAIYGRDDKSLRPKVREMFRKEAEARGESASVLLGRGNNMKAYREDYAHGFYGTMVSRLQQMRMSRGTEGGLMLADRMPKVNEAFYERHPTYRPASGSAAPYKAANDGCAKCAKAKSGYCREHGWMRPRKAAKGRETNFAAYHRGSDAAKTVDLGRGGRGPLEG